jgi:catechol 2,3-dioxygenase-like lactoylglutathione lyase family enzyme
MGVRPFAPRGIDHVVLRVKSLARAVRFYRDVLGCALERRKPGLGLVQLRAGRSLIDLVSVDGALGAGTPRGRNVDHFCLTVAPFDEAGVSAWLAARRVSAGAPASRYGAQGQGLSFYIEDPDGNRVELKGVRPERPKRPERVAPRRRAARRGRSS